ncbi:MAG TPA: cytochrome c oxidase subunit II [Thermoanaerobaculia bacterium]|jgi:cytochrome c oxidase subunit 2
MILAARGIQSALEPAGPHADRIGSLWDIFLVVSVVVFVLVMLALLAAVFHRRNHIADEEGNPKTALTVVTVASGITVVVLFALLIASVATSRAIAFAPQNTVNMRLTGHQWWWTVEYEHPDQSKRIVSANELYIPVGTPVHIRLRSTDVIHSFWVPNLHGKQDLIPARDGAIILQADRPGVFRGQCAEFCGLQHAKMAFWVTALPPAEFAQWAEQQRRPSRIPATEKQRKGYDVFMSSPCPLCHTIRGTDASGNTAPDLTHFASRRSIAAGTLPNKRGYLAGWILDPQHIKPGSQMPPMLLEKGDLDPLLDYLESLQ